MTTTAILVTGATGKTGRRIVQRLAGGSHAVRMGSRSATPAFEWSDPGTWTAALRGVGAAYICYYPDLAAPGTAETIDAFVTVARDAGVRRLVLLSGRGEPEAKRCEEVVAASGLEWTVLRASWFSQNFSEGYLLEPLLAGEVVLPAGNVGEPFVDANDIAEIGRASGREIRYVQVPIADYAAALRDTQVPPEVAELVTYLFSEILDGRNASVGDGVQRALGRAPRDFADYARATAATGAWTSTVR